MRRARLHISPCKASAPIVPQHPGATDRIAFQRERSGRCGATGSRHENKGQARGREATVPRRPSSWRNQEWPWQQGRANRLSLWSLPSAHRLNKCRHGRRPLDALEDFERLVLTTAERGQIALEVLIPGAVVVHTHGRATAPCSRPQTKKLDVYISARRTPAASRAKERGGAGDGGA